MKVLIVFNHPAPYKVRMFNELAKLVDLTVLFERTKAKDRPIEFYKDNKYDFNHIFLKSGYVGNEGNVSSAVKKYIKEHHQEYDLIVMNGYSHLAEIKAINFMAKHNIPFSLLINGGVKKEKEFFLKRKIKASLVKKASYYMSPCKEANEYLEFYGADPAKIYAYPYSNLSKEDIITLPVDKNAIREKYGLPKDRIIFVTPGMFIKRKNNLQLMKLFFERDDILLLIGEGKEIASYHKFMLNNVTDNIILLPYMEKESLFEVLSSCNVLVSLSKFDIYGHTILEGFANGLPVVASNKIVSALGFIKDGENGYIVPLEDKDYIHDCLTKAVDLDSKNCLKTVKELTFDKSAQRLAEIFSEIKNG